MAAEKQELAILVHARDLASKTIGKVNRSLSSLGKHARQGVASAARNLAKLGTIAAGVGIGVAAVGIKLAAGFEDQMNRSLAIVSGVTPKIRKEMESTARDVARTTTFSAEEAAEAYFFLASAGLDAEQQIAAMPAVAKFAQAGMFDLATATDLVTDAQSALGLKSKDAGKNLKNLTQLSDQLVKANTLSNATVEQFSTSLTTKAGAAMRKFGIDTAEGLGVLAVFADAGVKGEKAGTTFASMLTGLTNAATKNEKAFKKYNLQIFDANGELRPMTDITRDLTRVMGDMTDEQRAQAYQQLGINRLTANGVDLLLGQGKAQETYEKKLRKAGGTTEKVANKQLQSFSAQLSILKSHLEDIGIAIGGAFLPGLTKITKKVSKFLASKEGQAAVANFADRVGKSFDKAVTAGEKFLTGLDWEAIKANLGNIVGAFAEVGKEVGPAVLEALKAMPWETIGESAQFLAQGARKALELFTGAPPWLKTAIVTGWGLNKLTGGAAGAIISELGKGLIKGVLGISAGVVNITAGAVNGGGGVGGAAKGGRLGGLLGGAKVLGGGLLATGGVAAQTGALGGGSGLERGAGAVGTIAGGALIAGPVGALVGSAAAVGIEAKNLADTTGRMQDWADAQIEAAKGMGAAEANTALAGFTESLRQKFETGNVLADIFNKGLTGTVASEQVNAGVITQVENLETALLTADGATREELSTALANLETVQQLAADHGIVNAETLERVEQVELGIRTKLGQVHGAATSTAAATRDVRAAVNALDLSVQVNVSSQTSISARDVANKQVKTVLRAVPV